VVETKGKSWPSSHDKREVKSTLVVVRGLTLYVTFMIRSKPYTRTGIGSVYIYVRLYQYVTTYLHAFIRDIHKHTHTHTHIYIYIYIYIPPWRYTTHSGCVFYSLLSGFSLLAYEVT